MQTNSNISSEVDAIIARAMAEYAAAKGIEVFSDSHTTTEPDPLEESVIRESPEPVHNEIPQNSSSILVEESTSRFSSAVWFDTVQSKVVTLAGLGGIGSYVAFLLARLHVSQLYLYDDDVVEAGNMSGQLYGTQDVGIAKVNAIADAMSRYSNYYSTYNYGERFTDTSSATDIMICGFDNMDARRTFFRAWKEHVNNLPAEEKHNCLFIDGRLAAESLQVFCIVGDDTYNIEKYENQYLFEDWEAEEAQCSYKQTSFMANMIGSFIVNLFVNFCANQCDPLVPRDLPFFTEYTAETMYLKLVN